MLADIKFPFALIGVTETWINSDHSVAYHLPGYTFIFICQETKLRAGGVGAFIRNDVTFHIRNELSPSADECEILWVGIVNKSNNI